jgi:hypothetical protein
MISKLDGRKSPEFRAAAGARMKRYWADRRSGLIDKPPKAKVPRKEFVSISKEEGRQLAAMIEQIQAFGKDRGINNIMGHLAKCPPK